jgi:hypothetical protein
MSRATSGLLSDNCRDNPGRPDIDPYFYKS